MNKRLYLQLLICVALSLVLGGEWAVGKFSRDRLQTVLDTKIQSDYQAEDLPQLAFPKSGPDGFSDVVERPLFIEGRKPLAEAVENAETVENGQIDDWSLIGIYTQNKQQLALFRQQSAAGKFLKLHQDQHLLGWQLQQIQSDRVVLQQGSQQKTVMLRKPRVTGKVPVTPKLPVTAKKLPTSVNIPGFPPINKPSSENNDDAQ